MPGYGETTWAFWKHSPSVVAPAFLYGPAVPHFNPVLLGQGPHLSSKDGQVMLIWSIQIPPSLTSSAWYLDG